MRKEDNLNGVVFVPITFGHGNEISIPRDQIPEVERSRVTVRKKSGFIMFLFLASSGRAYTLSCISLDPQSRVRLSGQVQKAGFFKRQR